MNTLFTHGFALLTATLSVCIIAAYVISFVIRHGIPSSLSATFYMLKHRILFSLTMFSTAALVIPGIAAASAPHTQWYGYLGVVGLFVVGSAPRFKEIHQRRIHEFGAAMAIFGTTLWVVFNHPDTLLLWSAFVIYKLLHLCFRNSCDKPLFVIEMVAFAAFYTALFANISQL